MKKIFCLLLAILSVLVLAGCKSAPSQNLWALDLEVDHHVAEQKLRAMSLYPEELSLVVEPLYTTVYLRLNDDGTFVYYQDPETEKQRAREFFIAVFDSMYKSRTKLSDVYQTDFADCAKEDFIRFYTDLYTVADYDALIEKFVASAYDYSVFGEITQGTYTQKDGIITMDAQDNSYDDSGEYTIKDDQLTLNFVDRLEVYNLVTEE